MTKITRFIQEQKKYNLIIGGLVIIVIVLVAFDLFHKTKGVQRTTRPTGEQVSVASVASLSPNNASLSVIGKVESENEATILSETSGEIVSLNNQIGDYVSAGDVIATMENSSEQAAVTQAEGAYESAQANLAQVSGTTAENSSVSSNQAAETAQNAQTAVLVSLENTYAALDDAIHTKSDTFFNSPRSISVSLDTQFPVDSQTVIQIENERSQLEPLLQTASTLSSDTNVADIDANVTTMITTSQAALTLINNLISVINTAIQDQTLSQSTATQDQTLMSTARTEVVTAITTLTAAKTTYDTDSLSATTATNSADTGTQNSIAVAQANVKSALGTLDAAKAALAKTIITSPISGTIVSLPVTNGDYVNSFTEIAEVSNPSALKVVAYVTSTDAQTLAIGNKAIIDNTVPGVITHIAPAINPQTGTIEVDVGITGNQNTLTDGDSITVALDRSVAQSTTAPSENNTQNIIPIVALKITPNGPVVFTVNSATKTLVSHPVTVGSILGEDIVVTGGITPDMLIVTDARGLTDGEIVSIKQP